MQRATCLVTGCPSNALARCCALAGYSRYKSGVVQTAAGVEQVQCHLIGAGPLRYPPKAKRYKYVGQVIVKFGVDQQGKVTDPYVVASEPPGVFERAALKHVKSYKYKPPLLAGEPTHVDEVAIKLVFNPNKG